MEPPPPGGCESSGDFRGVSWDLAELVPSLQPDSRHMTMRNENLNAIVKDRIDVAPGLMILRVIPDDWELPRFDAGQFAVLALPESASRSIEATGRQTEPRPWKLIKRAYSISSASMQGEYWEFYVSLVRSGELTPRLFALRAGDRLWLSQRTSGFFTLAEVPEEKHVVLIATGTGLAPYMSMLRSHFSCGGSRRFVVLHGARHSWDLGYHGELLALMKDCPNYRYLPTVSRPQEEPYPWYGFEGHVQDLWRKGIIEEAAEGRFTPRDTHVFLCGNPTMIEEMLGILEEEGYTRHERKTPGEVHAEKYW
jgi:ferredoxin--NADP+ reductase